MLHRVGCSETLLLLGGHLPVDALFKTLAPGLWGLLKNDMVSKNDMKTPALQVVLTPRKNDMVSKNDMKTPA